VLRKFGGILFEHKYLNADRPCRLYRREFERPSLLALQLFASDILSKRVLSSLDAARRKAVCAILHAANQ
jgi:hypothetical protein